MGRQQGRAETRLNTLATAAAGGTSSETWGDMGRRAETRLNTLAGGDTTEHTGHSRRGRDELGDMGRQRRPAAETQRFRVCGVRR